MFARFFRKRPWLQINKTKTDWDKEYQRGDWDKLDNSSIERERHQIIGSFCQEFYPQGRILDVGCGLGTLVDFLNPHQIKNYLGIDISEVAITKAKLKKVADFKNSDFTELVTTTKFDIIVFNEIIYYFSDLKFSFNKALSILNDDGLIIISLSGSDQNKKGNNRNRQIWKINRHFLKTLKNREITGQVDGRKFTWQIRVLKRK